MTKKRLIRDKKWFFQTFPYVQIHMDNDLFKGWVAINYLTDGEIRYWNFEKAGSVPVAGKDIIWLTIIPESASRSITAFFKPNRHVSAWYIDVIESAGIDEDGIVYFIDKYLDVMLTPEGDILIDDRDELEIAFNSGELSTFQYEQALKEGERIVIELGRDIKETEEMCRLILEKAEEMIFNDRFTIFLDIDGVLDIFNPDEYIQKLLPEAVSGLKNLIARTKGDLVVISDWRYGSKQYRSKAYERGYERSIDNWDNLLKLFDDEGIIISGVTTWDDGIHSRTEEIEKYLIEHPDIRRYVILDDCFGDNYESNEEIRKHLVYVDALKGLQQNDLIAACEIMNKKMQNENNRIQKSEKKAQKKCAGFSRKIGNTKGHFANIL